MTALEIIILIIQHTLTDPSAPWWFWAFTISVFALPIVVVTSIIGKNKP